MYQRKHSVVTNFIHFLIIYLNLLIIVHCSDEILGCGGFVKSNVTINYARIFIKLYSPNGIVKYSTECAPNNGYYFIPIYDNGDYILQIEPPKGWHFEPNHVPLSIDGETDSCALQNDINFVFKGFTITGKVLSDESSDGPSGVNVQLKSSKTGDVLKSNVTEINGIYQLNSVFPGDYIIEGHHKTWKFKRNEIKVSIIDDNTDITNNKNGISILGFDVSGLVKSDDEPIKDVIFALYSKDSISTVAKSVSGCDPKAVSLNKPLDKGLNYLCHSKSDENGMFKFGAVSNGKYRIIPFYHGKHIQFEVKPLEYDFIISNDNLRITQIFNVEGFSVSGRIILPNGKGISDAEVTLIDDDGKRENKVIHTQENGIYHLENIKTGHYTILVKSKHIHFTSTTVKISPTNSQIQDIVASAFDVCGQLIFKTEKIPIKLYVESDKIEAETLSDENGNFCFILKPLSYKIKLKMKSEHKHLLLLPLIREITVTSAPILDLKFHQFTASISGTINTKSTDSTDIQLQLYSVDTNSVVNVWKSAQLKSNVSKFKFDNVLPGVYSIMINQESDSWCWIKESYSIDVTDKDINGIDFNQKGYIMPLYFSHTINLNIKYPSNKVETVKVHRDSTLRHCVTESGIYVITPFGCHKFSENNEIIKFDTSKHSGKLISRTAVEHLLTAKVISNVNVSDIIVTVKIKGPENDETIEKIHLNENKVVNQQKKEILYEYPLSLYVKPMVSVYFEPVSSHLLFKPHSFEIQLENDCLDNAVVFNGRKGLFINGQITPNIEGVSITIKHDENVLFNTVSDSSGKYIAGPFDSDADLKIFTEKEGYILKEITEKFGHFSALKLAKIIVRIKTENNNEPLPGVLISISGGTDNFRKNSITTNGELIFNNLHAGQYYVRIMMKEYDFDPYSKMIDVTEGSTITIDVRAKKIAFSCIGTIVSLNGEAESGVLIEAVGVKNITDSSQDTCSQFQEEAVSEPNGAFKIKGLRPECEYAIRLKLNHEKNKHLERSIPFQHLVLVKDSDFDGVRLIVFRRMTHMDVSGDVLTPSNYLSSIKIRLFHEMSPEQPINTIGLGSSAFFFFSNIPIDNKSYYIRLESSLSTNMYEFDSPIRSFKANATFLHFTFIFAPKLRSNPNYNYHDQELISQGSIYTLPFLLLLTIVVYNYSMILPYVNQFIEFMQKFSILDFKKNYNENSPSLIKRKAKARKI